MAMNAAGTMRPAGWSGELQDLQEETIRLLHTIRGGTDSRRQQSPGGRASQGGGTTSAKGGMNLFHRRRRKRRGRKHAHASGGQEAGLEGTGPKSFSYTLDTTQWPGEETRLEAPASEMDTGKTTVEVLDRGEETPRSPAFSGRPADTEGQPLDGGGNTGHVGKPLPYSTSKIFQATGAATDGDDEGRFRHLAFKDEEGRVRDGTDTYIPGHAGLGRELKRLRTERDRLASIENAQREACCGAKREEFLRFTRRKWLASDLAAEKLQRVFRGHIGRRRAELVAEVRRLNGQARAEWIEVRDHNRGEAWYFNPLTGISQWDRPDSLLGTMTPSEKVRTLPALEPRSPSKKRPLRTDIEATAGTELASAGEGKYAPPSSQPSKGLPGTSPIKPSTAKESSPGASDGGIDAAAATAPAVACTGSSVGTVKKAPGLPPLSKGASRRVLPGSSSREFAPSSGLGGELDATDRGGAGEKKHRDWQHAWIEDVGEEGEEEGFPFLVEDEVLVDDRFEETGLGLARREEEDKEAASGSSDDSKNNVNGAKGFFLADGTPNIRLRRTIAKALRVTKFDSVSTLLSDYTGRNLAASTSQDSPQTAAPSRIAPTKRDGRATAPSPGSGSRWTRKRTRVNNAAKVVGNPETGGVGGDRNASFPTGKLEGEKNPPLFPSSADGGRRRMVSLMTAAGKKSGSGGVRRVKTAGISKKTGEKGSMLKGLAIRDLTPPGFLPPPAEGNPPPPTNCVGDRDTAHTGTPPNGGASDDSIGAKQAGVGVTVCKVGIAEGKEIETGRAAATAVAEKSESVIKEVCFNCWSKGSGKTCTLHTGGPRERGAGGGGGGKTDGQARQAESALMCKNWDVGVMRRRYRSEELQEVFAKEASSLRYDKERKTFVAIVEQRHPIYRLLAKVIAGYNFTVRRKMHQKNWMRGFVEQLRMGKVAGASAAEVGKTAKILRLRNTLQNLAQVKAFTATAKVTQPQAPVTGSTLAERLGLVRVLVDRPSTVMARVTKVILDGPTPVPHVLYEARRYPLPPEKTMPMPEPKYLDMGTGYDHEEPPVREQQEMGEKANEFRSAWMPILCASTAGDIVRSAVANVEVMSPVPGTDDLARTKHPPALTIKFATFSRKATPGMFAVGGLPAEMVVHMLVSTRMPPQYGNFTVMQKSSVAPTVSPERSAEYKSLELLVENQTFLLRELLHPLNSRKAPTVTLKTLMADPGNRHYFGLNRPEQTGEADAHGFRTSAHADTVPALPTLDPTAFTPSEEVVTPNLCSANRTVTTHADRSYPFCEPSNRSNTTLDFYHLLLTATCSPNKEQVFTNLGVQECGEFMRGSDASRPMGHCIGVVYRSWAFLQRQILEEFETDDGVPYWFDRRTGETFWERPLCEEEKMPVKEGGTILGGQGEPPDTSSGQFEDIKPRYDQQEMRKLMMKSHEGTEALERRRKQVATQVKWARSSGALPPPDPSDLKPPTPNERDEHDDDQLEPEEGDSSKALVATGATSSGESTSNSFSSKKNDPPGGSVGSPLNGHPNSRQGRGGQDRTSANTSGGNGSPGGGVRGTGIGPEAQLEAATGRSKADRFAASIAEALKEAGLSEGRSVKPSDMLRFGMGLGITLGANGLLSELEGERGGSQSTDGRGRARRADADGGEEATAVRETSLAPPVIKDSASGHPIGHGHAEPIAEKQECAVLDHKSEAEHLASIVRGNTELKTSDEFKGLLVVPPAQPTPCPDESYKLVRPEDMELDPRRKAELSIPIVAYPETLWKKQYRGHGGAGEGVSWQPAGGDRAENQRAKSSQGVPMRRTNEPLPEGFLNAISHTHVGKQHCDYLPHVPNMPQARAVGRVKPRSAAEDWFAVGFDPWSAGREPLSAEFIPTLSIKQEDLGADEEGGGISTVPQAGYLELKDSAGHAEMAIVSAEEAKMASDFEQISSWARHARYSDVETAMNQADWTMPIDYQNELGVTLLHVAAQNGNKRIAKLCLRKGADVNKCNNNGQTPLHYAYGYGFESFGEYLISKGADDSIVNADGLTCYEGLSKDNLGQL